MGTEASVYDTIKGLIEGNEGAGGILRCMSSSLLPWSEFLSMRLPSEFSPVELWDLLELLNRATGIEVPIPDLDDNDYWYTRTHELTDTVAAIQCMCQAGSDVHRQMTATLNTQVLVRSRIDETMAAALLDGLVISEQDGYAQLQLDRAPRNDTERLVLNTLTALDDLGDLIDVPFSKELFMHLRYLLLEGVDVAGLKVAQPRMGLLFFDYPAERTTRLADRQLDYISVYANHASGDPHDLPLIRALLLPDMFRLYRPVPDLSAQVGRLAFRLYALKTGLPVLGMLPLSRAKLRWEEKSYYSSVVRVTPESHAEARLHSPTNLTSYMTLVTQLAMTALKDLTWSIERLRQRDEELRDLLQHDPDVNHRQRSVLGRALRNPDAEFRIAYHKTAHNVVYATARADMLELAEKGYLVMSKKGKAHVFKAREGLREYIEGMYTIQS
ncbi:MAG: Fic family protein [Coriobacteriia bacterium]